MGLFREQIVVCGGGGFIGGHLTPGPQENTRSKSTASRLAAFCISTIASRVRA